MADFITKLARDAGREKGPYAKQGHFAKAQTKIGSGYDRTDDVAAKLVEAETSAEERYKAGLRDASRS
jgi:hypothetical protein